jgi:DNA repair protein RecN (Recombination protein N)
MLRQLTIRDFVIVDRLELSFSAGFGALTGETGAGKSILIDALALALGERAEAGMVREGCDRAEVTAAFDVTALPQVSAWLKAQDFAEDEELLLRRVVDAGGRSRAYINGTPASAQQLREVGEWLVDIHGQHAHQSLLRADAQRQLFDAHAGLTDLVRQVGEAWRAWRDAEQAMLAAQAGSAALEQEREQLHWQIEELTALNLGGNEWSELEQEHRRLGAAAGLIEGAQAALQALGGDEGGYAREIDRVAHRLQGLAELDTGLGDIAALVASAQTELAEAVSALRRYTDRIDLDPARLASLEQRIEAILDCARKFRVTPPALPALLDTWLARQQALSAAVDLAALAQSVAVAEAAYLSLARGLSSARVQAAQAMGEAVSGMMQQLALSSGRFEVALLPLDTPAAHGLEGIEFRIGGLAGQVARPLAKVASGGELSRISLAIQVLTSRSAQVPTLIFDEVDVGIGGGVAEIVGRLLNELGEERQVLCVTHLPQVAARAAWQWQVSKMQRDGVTRSAICALDTDGRVQEIARMLGGVDITDLTREHAREMLGFSASTV